MLTCDAQRCVDVEPVSVVHPIQIIRIALLAGVLACLSFSANPARSASSQAIVTVVRHGGLCSTGMECRSVLRITDTAISGQGYVTRRLTPAARTRLLRAVRRLDPAYLRRHPFKGTCPVAYDGTESIYRFRGFARPLASCTYDLSGVAAVREVERLLGTLEPR